MKTVEDKEWEDFHRAESYPVSFDFHEESDIQTGLTNHLSLSVL